MKSSESIPLNASRLRHSLRTPLNHVIGYSEMMQEDLADTILPVNAAALEELDAIVFNGRELVRFVQNAFAADRAELSPTEMRDLQFWLRPHVVQLLENIGALAAVTPAEHAEDVHRMRQAADRLLAFAEGHAEALEETEQQAAEAEAASPEGSKTRILVVDDNPTNRDLLRRNLDRQGYEVVTVTTGESAIKALNDSPFDLVLLDVVMPGGQNGFEVLQTIKATPALSKLPVIMISALDETSSIVRCMNLGAEDYFMKPFDPVLLRTRIRSALERRKLRDDCKGLTEAVEQARHRVKAACAALGQTQPLVGEALRELEHANNLLN